MQRPQVGIDPRSLLLVRRKVFWIAGIRAAHPKELLGLATPIIRHVIHLTAFGFGRSAPTVPSLVPRPETIAAPIVVQKSLLGSGTQLVLKWLRIAGPSDIIGRKMSPHGILGSIRF